jgi:hypothetical protein
LYAAQARLKFSRVRSCNLGEARVRYYSRAVVRVRYRAGNPFGERPGWKTFKVTTPDGGQCALASG